MCSGCACVLCILELNWSIGKVVLMCSGYICMIKSGCLCFSCYSYAYQGVVYVMLVKVTFLSLDVMSF